MIKNLKLYERVLIVVDMVNGFVYNGPLHDIECSKIIPRQKEIIDDHLDNGDLVVFIKDTHTKDSTEFSRMPIHCLENTDESELVPELREYVGRDNVITINKNSTSFNEAPEFRELITNLVNLKRVDEIGVCTDICDFNGIMGLANRLNQENRDVSIYVHEDAVATFNETERREYVEAAKLLMKQQGINIIRK
ncbi:MAG: isochorismatase family cysteine hydrolase [Bacilli bacterium]|nr:isochorismatase family cysteine hydrolase [Bacilli bacterium]